MSVWGEIPGKVTHPFLLCWHPFILLVVFVVHLFLQPTGLKWCLSMDIDQGSRSQTNADKHLRLGLELGLAPYPLGWVIPYSYESPHKDRNACVYMCVYVCAYSACPYVCSLDEFIGSVNCRVINESTVHHRGGGEGERDVKREGEDEEAVFN